MSSSNRKAISGTLADLRNHILRLKVCDAELRDTAYAAPAVMALQARRTPIAHDGRSKVGELRHGSDD